MFSLAAKKAEECSMLDRPNGPLKQDVKRCFFKCFQTDAIFFYQGTVSAIKFRKRLTRLLYIGCSFILSIMFTMFP